MKDTLLGDSLLYRLWKIHNKKYKFLLIISTFVSIFSLGMSLIMPKAINWFSEAIKSGSALTIPILKLLAVALLASFFSYISAFIQAFLNEQSSRLLRHNLARAFIWSSLEKKDRIVSGHLNAIMLNDIDKTKGILSQGFSQFLPGLFSLIAILFLMTLTDIALTFISLLLVSIAGFIVFIFSYFMSRKAKAARLAVDNTATEVSSLVDERLIIECENAHAFQMNRFCQSSNRLYKVYIKQALLESGSGPFNTVLFPCLVLSILIIGISRVSSGSLSLVSLLTFISYSFILLIPIGNLAGFFSNFSKALPSLKLVFDSIDSLKESTEMGISTGEIKEKLDKECSYLSVKNLCYSFKDSNQVMGPLSMCIRPGVVTIIRGANGIGKSTLLKVLSGLYGTVTDSTLAEKIHFFPQSDLLISASLKDNIVFGREYKKNINNYLQKVGLSKTDFSDSTVIGANGIDPSGGEIRRLSWLRICFSQAKYLFLDEPTTGVDKSGIACLVSILKDKYKFSGILVITHDDYFVSKLESTFPCQQIFLN